MVEIIPRRNGLVDSNPREIHNALQDILPPVGIPMGNSPTDRCPVEDIP